MVHSGVFYWVPFGCQHCTASRLSELKRRSYECVSESDDTYVQYSESDDTLDIVSRRSYLVGGVVRTYVGAHQSARMAWEEHLIPTS